MFAATSHQTTDPDMHAHMNRATSVELVRIEDGAFQASATCATLGCIRLQQGQETRGALAMMTTPAGRIGFSLMKHGSAPIIRNTTTVTPRDLTVLAPGKTTSWNSVAHSAWAALSLPVDDFARSYQALTGQEAHVAQSACFLRPDPVAMARLHTLHDAAIAAARTRPEVVGAPEAVRSLEQTLIEVLIAAHHSSRVAPSDSGRNHPRIMELFLGLLEANPDRAMYMAEVCTEIDVPGRTLRLVCAKYFGTSPQNYLYRRRLHLARRALLQADGATATVTEIATQFGFWELGRLAVGYRAQFGESPMVTLRESGDRFLAAGRPQPAYAGIA
jgi:AraC-like DNA-binding protein